MHDADPYEDDVAEILALEERLEVLGVGRGGFTPASKAWSGDKDICTIHSRFGHKARYCKGDPCQWARKYGKGHTAPSNNNNNNDKRQGNAGGPAARGRGKGRFQ